MFVQQALNLGNFWDPASCVNRPALKVYNQKFINRSGVAGADLQSPLLVNNLIKESDGLWKYLQNSVCLQQNFILKPKG